MNTYFMSSGLNGRFAEDYIPTLIVNDKRFLEHPSLLQAQSEGTEHHDSDGLLYFSRRHQARDQVDATVVHDLQRERRPAPTPRAGVQPRQPPPHARPARRGRTLVADHATGEKVVKIGAKVIGHGRYAIFQMAEVAAPRELFGRILEAVEAKGF
jgi:hypothetical protein